MSLLSPKLRSVGFGTAGSGISHWCPGCGQMHAFRTSGNPPVWNWDGNADNPTITPSIKITSYGGPNDTDIRAVCHYILTAGQLQFCADSTHRLKGQSVPLPDLPAKLR